MGKNGVVLESNPGDLRSMNQVLLDRGMNLAECKAMCTSPIIPLREKLFFRMIDETTFRPFEVQHLRIEEWDRATREITARKVKVKYNPRTKAKISLPRSMKLTENTNEMLRAFVGNRKKGYIFQGEKGKPLTLRLFEKEIDRYARLLSIQRDKQITPKGRVYHLVTLMALREAGERHHDQDGGDPAISAKAAGHTMLIKSRYYKKGSFEEAQESFEKHHPAFKGKW